MNTATGFTDIARTMMSPHQVYPHQLGPLACQLVSDLARRFGNPVLHTIHRIPRALFLACLTRQLVPARHLVRLGDLARLATDHVSHTINPIPPVRSDTDEGAGLRTNLGDQLPQTV